MLGNVALDGVLGAVPLVGDVFDVLWRANRRNVRLLLEWLEYEHRREFSFVVVKPRHAALSTFHSRRLSSEISRTWKSRPEACAFWPAARVTHMVADEQYCQRWNLRKHRPKETPSFSRTGAAIHSKSTPASECRFRWFTEGGPRTRNRTSAAGAALSFPAPLLQSVANGAPKTGYLSCGGRPHIANCKCCASSSKPIQRSLRIKFANSCGCLIQARLNYSQQQLNIMRTVCTYFARHGVPCSCHVLP
jgi:hypothetical protein